MRNVLFPGDQSAELYPVLSKHEKHAGQLFFLQQDLQYLQGAMRLGSDFVSVRFDSMRGGPRAGWVYLPISPHLVIPGVFIGWRLICSFCRCPGQNNMRLHFLADR